MVKRQFPRYRKNLLVNISHNGYDGLGLVMNVSRRGVYVESVEIFPPQTRLSLLLAAGNHLIPLTGTVAWRKETTRGQAPGVNGGMGIQFVRVPRQYARYLKEFRRGEQG